MLCDICWRSVWEVAVADSELELAEAIDVLRAELRKAQDSGRGADVRFSVGPVEVELAVEVVRKAGGEASVKVLNLLSVGGKGEVSKARRTASKWYLTQSVSAVSPSRCPRLGTSGRILPGPVGVPVAS
jgi:NTP-dependent ternary system trypsin peptidase co-occuring protein